MEPLTREQRDALRVSKKILAGIFKTPDIEPPTDTTDEGLKAYAIETSTSLKAARMVVKMFEKLEMLAKEGEEIDVANEEQKSEEFVEREKEAARVVGQNL